MVALSVVVLRCRFRFRRSDPLMTVVVKLRAFGPEDKVAPAVIKKNLECSILRSVGKVIKELNGDCLARLVPPAPPDVPLFLDYALVTGDRSAWYRDEVSKPQNCH